jgi:hypothetical protein
MTLPARPLARRTTGRLAAAWSKNDGPVGLGDQFLGRLAGTVGIMAPSGSVSVNGRPDSSLR